jgi:hypothetical protein
VHAKGGEKKGARARQKTSPNQKARPPWPWISFPKSSLLSEPSLVRDPWPITHAPFPSPSSLFPHERSLYCSDEGIERPHGSSLPVNLTRSAAGERDPGNG